MNATVLFAGCGGSSVGLENAGYRTVGYEYWKPAVDTHRANGMWCNLHDLSDATFDMLVQPCDLLWASPPCQPFSAAGNGDGEFDDRDGFPWTLRIVGKIRPQLVIIENVKGLTFDKHAEYFGSVLHALTDLGYEWEWKVLNSADYGVPQTRERCFIVARNDGRPIRWPMPTHTAGDSLFLDPWVTMSESLGMCEGYPGWGRPPFNQIILNYRQNAGATGEPITCDVTHRPAPTIGTQSQGQWIVNEAIRLTIAELARLQDFPDDYVWTSTKTNQARMIGNAVPPVMAQRLAEANK